MTEDTQMAPKRIGTVKDVLLVLFAAFVTVAVIVLGLLAIQDGSLPIWVWLISLACASAGLAIGVAGLILGARFS
jgi:hypothetical protein